MRKRWVVPTPTESDDEQLLTALRSQRLQIHRATNGQVVADVAEARQNKQAFPNALETTAFGEGCLKG
ncbi:MAG: hypothetical protein PVTTEEND_001886 [Candidatus Fervidibacter sp.]|jgi:hypothetical protein